MDAIGINHSLYGAGEFVRLLPEIGHALVAFDIDGGTQRRVLVRDLTAETLRERGARIDAAVADMMGRDPRAVVAELRESAS